jgi:signal transduction histidine kinase/CHASE1-domain containing sensor protein/ActR/RegA family two-component response regulator
LGLAYIVFFAGLLLTALTAHFAYEKSRLSAEFLFEEVSQSIRQKVHDRFLLYLNALQQTRALVLASPNLNRSIFDTYTANLNLSVAYPGAVGIAYSPRVPKSELNVFNHRLAKEYDSSKYKLWSGKDGESGDYFPVLYFAPEEDLPNRLSVIGFDMGSEHLRRAALETARDTGEPMLTKRVRLIHVGGSQAGFVLILPVYKQNAPLNTVAERRAALTGFVMAPFRAFDFFHGILEEKRIGQTGVDFQVFDQGTDASSPPSLEQLVFQHVSASTVPFARPGYEIETHIGLAGRPLTLRVFSLPSFEASPVLLSPIIILVSGFLLNLVIFRMLIINQEQQNKIAKSEDQIRLITDALPVFITYVDANRVCRFVNKTYGKWFLRDPFQASDTALGSVIGTRNLERIQPFLDRALRGENLSIESEWEIFGNSFHPVLLNLIPDSESEASVKGVIMLVTDISAQKRQETNQRLLSDVSAVLGSSLDMNESLERLAAMITPLLADWCTIDVIDDHGPLRRAAAATSDSTQRGGLYELRHLDPSEKSVIADVIHHSEPQLLSSRETEGMAPPSHDVEERLLLQAAGVQSEMHLPLKSPSQTLGAISFYSTKSDRHFTEEDLAFAQEIARRAALAMENARLYRDARLANRAKDEFLATLSHELRTPMNVILGWLEILSTEAVDAKTLDQALTTLTRNAQAQIQLINDLLDVSRIISGKMNLNVQRTDLSSSLLSGVESVRLAARAKNITLQLDLPSHAIAFDCDSDRIQQVLWNLLSNSVKFTKDGGTIIVRALVQETAVVISVADNGQGIDPRFLPYVFDRFRQEDGSTTRSQGGLGLGLAIVRSIVEMHGGSITAQSEGRDKGTLFTMTFPRKAEPAALPPRQENEKPAVSVALPEQSPLAGIAVLLVDDSPDVRVLITRILTRAGANVTAVENAPAAFDLLSRSRFDVLLSDIGLPGEDGFGLIERVRLWERSRGHHPIPAAALTAYAQDIDARKALSSGFTCHLAKPVASQDLLVAVSTLAGRISSNSPPEHESI